MLGRPLNGIRILLLLYRPSYPAQSSGYGQINDSQPQYGFAPPEKARYGQQQQQPAGYSESQQGYEQSQQGYGQPQQGYGGAGNGAVDEETAFFNEVRASACSMLQALILVCLQIEDIQKATRELNDNISRIGELHTRQLGAVANEQEHAAVTNHLSALTQDTRSLSNNLKKAIKKLEQQTAKRDPRDPNTNVRRNQVGAIKNR